MAEEYDDADFIAAAATFDSVGGNSNARSSGVSNRPASGSSTTGIVQPKPQALPGRSGPSSILVSPRQKGNPILNHVKSIPWEYSETPADYVLGLTTCALFLSLKYHRLHPEYIYTRIRQLGKLYNLRVLLCMVDINNHEEALKELSKTSMINNLTLIIAWSAQEAGRYLELFKSYEHASPASIRARQAETYRDSLTEFVTTPRNINKTDAASLISNFGSLRAAVNAQPEELALIPGWGEKKVKSWCSTVREPFRVKRSSKATSKIALLRQESTVASSSGAAAADGHISDDSTSATPDRGMTPIPIGRTPAASLSRENTTGSVSVGDAAAQVTQQQHGPKRQRLTEILPGDLLSDDIDVDIDDDNDDEEEALLLAAASSNTMTKPTGVQQPARPSPSSNHKNLDTNNTNQNNQAVLPKPAPRQDNLPLSSGIAEALKRLRENG